jgi:uncharacterized protein (TIGR02217 family)
MVLPDFISPYIVGGPNFDTAIVQTIAGRETRYPNLNTALQKYVIKGCRLSASEMEEFNCFFRNCKGAAHGFLLKDYADYQATNQRLLPEQQDQTIFPLFKYYQFDSQIYLRRILKPIPGKVQVFIDQVEAETELDYDYGLVKLQQPLTLEQNLSTNFEFYVPVRFCADSFNYSFSKDGSINLEDIELREIN